tara:strand:+ start:844 stop:1134 length:291 start_codon:yes stop_codon:yes gene_type:complete
MEYVDLYSAWNLLTRGKSTDPTLLEVFNEASGLGANFNGDAKDLNSAVKRGLWLAINEPANFDLWNEGWTQGTGWSIETLAEWYLEAVEEQIKEAI